MPIPTEIELAREKILQAEDALESYVRCEVYNPKQHKELVDILKIAINELIDKLVVLWPEI